MLGATVGSSTHDPLATRYVLRAPMRLAVVTQYLTILHTPPCMSLPAFGRVYYALGVRLVEPINTR